MKQPKKARRGRAERVQPTTRERAAMQMVGEYLTEAGLQVERRWPDDGITEILSLEESPDAPHARERLSSSEDKELNALGESLWDLTRWATGEWVVAARAGGALPVSGDFYRDVFHSEKPFKPEPAPATLPATERRAILAALRALPTFPGESLVFVLRERDNEAVPTFIEDSAGALRIREVFEAHAPTVHAVITRRRELVDRCRLTPEELAQRITDKLTRPDGTRAPSPREWCAARGYPFKDFRAGLYHGTAEKLHELERRNRELERKLAAEKRRKGLSDRIVLPAQLLDAGYRPRAHAALLRKTEQGELFPSTAQTLEVLKQSADVAVAQLGQLTSSEQRAMMGVFRAFTADGANGTEHFKAALELPAPVLYAAMNLSTPNAETRRRHFDALTALSAKVLRVALKLPAADGKGWAVVGEETPMFKVRPRWSASEDGRRAYTAEEADRIAEEWTRNAGREWQGPLPDTFRIDLPDIMRVVASRLVLTADTSNKLDTGAKQVRGPRESFAPLDFDLYLAITQTVQSQHGGRAYVDRDQLLEGRYGAEEFRKARAKGKLRGPSGYVTQYEKSVRVLEAGGIARRVHVDYRTAKKGEKRDVFELLPGSVLGRVGADPLALPLPLEEPTPAKRRRKRVAK